jgi:hypothetical protein
MGNGYFKNGKFDLYVCFFKMSTPLQKQCQDALNKASQSLYTLTGGQMQFGTIYELPNKSSDADIYIYSQKSLGTCAAAVFGIGKPNLSMSLYTDGIYGIVNNPYSNQIILHEFGHYAFCLYDEYLFNSQGQPLVHCALPTSGHCIMEYANLPSVYGYCNASTHDTNATAVPNPQQANNGQSCWETICRYYPEVVPPAKLPMGFHPPPFKNIQWQTH